jgi:HEAT repeat protein
MRLALAFVLSVVVSCGGGPVRDAALADDLPAFKRALADAGKRGELDEGSVKEIAHAVIARELSSSQGDAAVARVRDVRTCVGQVESLLDERSERRDPGAGAALLALLESGRVDGDDFVSLYEHDAEAAFRAVAARAAVGAEHGLVRRRLLIDADLAVRRGALHAALSEPDQHDLEALAEAARLDPDPLARSIAVQALGANGGQRAVELLADLWDVSDLATRQGIVEAWAKPKSFEAGGETRLLSTMETRGSFVAVIAAHGLLVSQSKHTEQAAHVLVRSAAVGPTEERRLALGWIPIAGEGEQALLDAQKSDDPAVSVVAATRLLSAAKHAKAAEEVLRRLAKNDSAPVRRQAQSTLAKKGDRSVLAALEQSQTAADPEERRHAALGLLSLGEYGKAAAALGDDVARVRTQVACATLVAR